MKHKQMFLWYQSRCVICLILSLFSNFCLSNDLWVDWISANVECRCYRVCLYRSEILESVPTIVVLEILNYALFQVYFRQKKENIWIIYLLATFDLKKKKRTAVNNYAIKFAKSVHIAYSIPMLSKWI